jgi:hypothetical protein
MPKVGLDNCLENHGFLTVDLEHALANASDVELLSTIQKIVISQEVSWEKGIPFYKKSQKLNLLANAILEELKARYYIRIQPKEHNIAETGKNPAK